MLNAKKILFMIGSLEYGGAEIHISKLLPELKKIGYEVTLLTLSDKGDLKKKLLTDKINLKFPVFKNLNQRSFFNKFLITINLFFSFLYICFFSLKNRDAILHFFLPTSYIV